ncbi:Membrane steroid-binding protein 2 [Apostasia shenzhenica]|uniref:Membrane steroid-binding protein 2 n=1 Tax=Apostasia shenzhenica TaxID=1088818 RepID=A0A2I0A692_9ASPA|nr:Membrane steroid-binding protein 2 [Apostasia shenzhenica]
MPRCRRRVREKREAASLSLPHLCARAQSGAQLTHPNGTHVGTHQTATATRLHCTSDSNFNPGITQPQNYKKTLLFFDSLQGPGERGREGEREREREMGLAELWATLEHAITVYTGLSPATFFTVVALAVAFYYAVSTFFAPAPAPVLRKREAEMEPVEPLPPPVQLGEVTEEELRAYDGSDPKKPLLMAIKGQIYDVTQSRMFYGPGGPYALFAGKDASRALAKMSFEQKDLTGDISGLGPFELEALQDWEYKFMSKYVKVGTIKKTVPATDGSASAEVTDPTAEGSSTLADPVADSVQTAESSDPTPASHGVESADRDDEKTSEPKLVEHEESGQAEEKKESIST